MRLVSRFGLLLLCLMTVVSTAGLASGAGPCPAIRLTGLPLPHVARTLHDNQELTIVALGSSSTAGWHASDIAHSYPAVLQTELEAALPAVHVAVINRGIGGQDVAEMLPRIEHDVLALAPSLVIWQVGANGALRNMDPAEFERLVDTGVRRLLKAGVDVVLMDNQRAPSILASPAHERIDQALADVAVHDGAGLFARGRLMEQWQTAGFPYADFISTDGVHHNDRGYACVAKALAASILLGLRPEGATVQSASARTPPVRPGKL